MLIPKNISPDNCIYYNAAFVLQALSRNNSTTPLPQLYCDTRKTHHMSYPVFELCLDWLYLIGCVDINPNGIEPCF